MEIDLHHYSLKEAKEYIFNTILEMNKKNETMLKVIHGSNHGTKIKDWIRNSKELKKYVSNVLPDLLNSGATILYLNSKIH